MTDRDESHLLTGAYALNALDKDDRAALEDYLEGSDDARREVNELSETAAMLGMATRPVAPSPELKANLMALISVTPQVTDTPRILPATQPAVQPVRPDVPASQDIRSIADGTSRAPGRAERTARSRWLSKPLGMLAAAAAAVALFAGGAALGQGLTNPSEQLAEANSFVEISTAADVQRSVSDVAGGGTATLLWSDSLQRSAVKVDDLPTLTGDQVYQLWYIGEAGVQGAGFLTTADAGSSWSVLDGEMGQSTAVGVTVEPKGGSQQPTTDPIVVLQDA